ncbi:beta-phosphoglucomutase [Emticicia sp. CRIBPO]|uniref:beta-phosphoglucomutase n=1 Tax=Emticicia sp. CRIBPO TaxID=2683258 RepID=UPI001411FBC0|nr:beta-phosphoglucomutase [Emticicia sp. CRIBPO]NBA84351.1 beta-phosphoglucomutase [Emticicia sp. CRIBPO]
MIKGFLFDLDGVIVDTAVFHYKAWKRLANELGFDIDEEFNERLKGISRMDSLNEVLLHGQIEITEEEKIRLATRKNEWYLDLVEDMTPDDVLPYVLDFLELSREAGIKIGLGSASKNAPKILDKTGLIEYFDVIIDGTKVSKSKPDPEVFLKGAQGLQLEAGECVVFEDAFAGVQAAIAAGMKSVGIGKKEVLYNASMVIPDFKGVDPEKLARKIK